MNIHKGYIVARHWLRGSRLCQIGLLIAIWALAQALVSATHLPVPSGFVGLAAVLVALGRRWISPFSLRRGASWFLTELLLFFVPAVLVLLNHPEFAGLLGLKILAVILVGTAVVMSVTALTVDFCCRWTLRHGH